MNWRNPVPGYHFRVQIVPTLFSVAAVILFLSLGNWQVRRLGESEQRRAAFTAQLALPPFDAEHPPEDVAFRRASIEGEPLWDHYFLIAGHYMWGQMGYQLVVPVRGQTQTVLVDTGWIPSEGATEIIARERAKTGPHHYEGLVNLPESTEDAAGSFKEEEGYQRRWRAIQPTQMAQGLGLTVAPWYITDGEAMQADTSPNDKEPPISGWVSEFTALPHLHYAITWFSLAGVTILLYIVFCFEKKPTSQQ